MIYFVESDRMIEICVRLDKSNFYNGSEGVIFRSFLLF